MFFRKPIFGLDISDDSIKVVSLKGSFYNPRLLAIGKSSLNPGVVEDGKILDKETLKRELLHLIRSPKFGKIKTNKFVSALPESKSFILIFELPKNLKKKEEVEFIKSQANQNLPFKTEDIYLDFKIKKRDNSKEALLVAVPKTIINDYLDVFKGLKLQPLAIETESISLGRSLIQNQKETTLIADIGARTTNFSIFDRRKLKFSLTIEIAGNKFTKALAKSLEISFEKAENLKKEVGLNPGVKEGKISSVLRREIQPIILEIRKIEKYFQKKKNKELEKVILAGGSAILPLLPEYLTEKLGKPVVVGDPWAKININILRKKEYFREAFGINPILYATCIGSALRGLTGNPERAGIDLMKRIG